jgi:hypothetical protein
MAVIKISKASNLFRIVVAIIVGMICTMSGTAAVATSQVPLMSDVINTVSDGTDQQLDPATYEGILVVVTDIGEFVVKVRKGEAALFLNRPDGKFSSLSEAAKEIIRRSMAPEIDCGQWVRSVAGPGVYWDSIDGCAVAGYPGYVREYSWSNGSDMMVCVQGRGWNDSGAIWGSLGCSDQGATFGVHWGNSLAYTKVRGMSLSGVTGAAYSWRA